MNAGDTVKKYIRARGIRLRGRLKRMAKNKKSEEDYGMESQRNERQTTYKK
jgi:hypothetical protein